MTFLDDDIPTDARVAAAILGGGALAFGIFGLVAPARLAKMMATDVDAARAVGFRDLGNALTFAIAPTRVAAAQRMVYDLGDAISFGPRKPGVAAGALTFALLAGWTAWRAK